MDDAARKTLLLVEDELITGQLYCSQLGTKGFAVVWTQDGEAAVEVALGRPDIDLVLMDIELGEGIDGPEAARRILERRELPIIFLSSHSDRESIARTERVMSFGYVHKDSGIHVLEASIRMAFRLDEANAMVRHAKGRLDSLLDAIGDAVIATDRTGSVIRFNPVAAELTGWTAEAALGRLSSEVLELVSAGTGERLPDPAGLAFTRGGRVTGGGFAILRSRDGGERRVSYTATPVRSGEALDGAVVALHDVDVEIRTQLALQESESHLRELFAHMSAGFALHRLEYSADGQPEDYTILEVNPAFEQLLGLSRGDVIGKTSRQAYGVAEPPYLAVYAEVVATGAPCRFETWFPAMERNFAISVYRPRRGHFVTMFDDTTNQKRTERALEASRERYRHLTESIKDVIWTLDAETGRFIYVSPAVQGLCGFTPEEVMAGPIEAVLVPEEAAAARGLLQSRVANLLSGKTAPGTFFTEELPQQCKDGSQVWTEVITSLHRNPDNGRVEVRGVSRDISERRRNDERLKVLVEIFQHRCQTVQEFLDFALEKSIELTGSRIGYIYHYHEDRRQFVLNIWSKDVLPACRVSHPQTVYDLEKTGIWGEAVRQRQPIVVNDFQAPNPLKRGYPEGHVALNRFMTIPLVHDGRIVAVIGLGNKDAPYDDTDVLQASLLMDAVWKVIGEMQSVEQVRKLLSEKEVLLKEVHHRIKNNMTVVYGLLQLQAASSPGGGVSDALGDAASRVQSMALLYEQLYCSGGYGEVPLDKYLPSLVRQVVANFPSAGKVRLEFAVEPVILATARIQPLGIILNELVTNSMKYAFEGRQNGLIRLAVSRRDGWAVLEFSDNGRGLPPEVEPGSCEGFGLNLIRILTAQIEGRLTLDREGGTRFVIEFPA